MEDKPGGWEYPTLYQAQFNRQRVLPVYPDEEEYASPKKARGICQGCSGKQESWEDQMYESHQ